MSNPDAKRSTELDPELSEIVASAMQRFSVPGLALGIHADSQQVLRGFGVTSIENPLPIDADTIFVAGSITKTVVATAVMCLVDGGRLDLDRPIRSYIPDLKLADESVAAAVTVRHLMTHTAGWVGDDLDDTDFGRGDDALARAIASFAHRPQILPLGSLWSYNNSAFWLAGRVIEVITAMSLEAAIGDLVFAPLGMTISSFFEADAITRRVAVGHNAGEPGTFTVVRAWSTQRAQHAAGGMLTSIADLMAFARFQLGDGHADDRTPVLSTGTLRAMHEPQVRGAGSEYAGIGWVVRDLAGHRVLAHGGDWNGQQGLLTLVPDRGLAIASLANSGTSRLANDAIAEWTLRRYIGSADPEPVPVEQNDERLDALVGRYALPDKAIEIARRGNRLGLAYLPATGQAVVSPALPEQPAALTTDGRMVVLDGPFQGITGDFAIPRGSSATWIRIAGRVYPREAPVARTQA